jgi:hypothetical protein
VLLPSSGSSVKAAQPRRGGLAGNWAISVCGVDVHDSSNNTVCQDAAGLSSRLSWPYSRKQNNWAAPCALCYVVCPNIAVAYCSVQQLCLTCSPLFQGASERLISIDVYTPC